MTGLPRSVLLLTNQLTTGGAEVYVLTVAAWLAARGVKVTVAAAPGELSSRLDPAVRYEPIALRDVRLGLPRAAWRVRRLVREVAPDVVVANSLVTAWVAKLAAPRLPVVAVAHGWAAERYRLVGRPLAVADRVVPVSEEVAGRLVAAGLPAGKVRVVPNGVDLSPFGPRDASRLFAAREACGARPDDVLAISVGRLVSQKAQHHLVEIARRLAATQPELKIVLVGEGPRQEELAARVAAAGVQGQVRLLGRRTDVPDLLMASDLYLSVSDWEGMPLSMIEAMAAGLPIVSTDVEGIAALVDDENGVRVPPGEVSAMTAAVSALVADEPGRLRRGAASRARAARSYSRDVMCQRLADVIGEVLA